MRVVGQRGGVAAAVVLLGVVARSASGQIISTSIPKPLEGEAEGRRGWAVHVMASPLARWSYAETYIDITNSLFGSIRSDLDSEVMVAGEVVFGGPDGLNVAVGGWYNRIGNRDFRFDGFDIAADPDAAVEAVFETELSIVEGHAALFFRSVGVQAGVVKTSSRFGEARIIRYDGNAVRIVGALAVPDGDTTDLDVFAVYKRAFRAGKPTAVNLSVGAGAYRKQGSGGGALRVVDAKTVPTGFVSASIQVFKGLGVDSSFWYVGKTDADTEFAIDADTMTRLTLGVGYTF